MSEEMCFCYYYFVEVRFWDKLLFSFSKLFLRQKFFNRGEERRGQNDDLVPFSGFRWVSKSTLGATFTIKNRLLRYLANEGERPGADSGATCSPKRSKDTLSSIWDRFRITF